MVGIWAGSFIFIALDPVSRSLCLLEKVKVAKRLSSVCQNGKVIAHSVDLLQYPRYSLLR
jgi:hypothetical protein